jgi:hypothetical protein
VTSLSDTSMLSATDSDTYLSESTKLNDTSVVSTSPLEMEFGSGSSSGGNSSDTYSASTLGWISANGALGGAAASTYSLNTAGTGAGGSSSNGDSNASLLNWTGSNNGLSDGSMPSTYSFSTDGSLAAGSSSQGSQSSFAGVTGNATITLQSSFSGATGDATITTDAAPASSNMTGATQTNGNSTTAFGNVLNNASTGTAYLGLGLSALQWSSNSNSLYLGTNFGANTGQIFDNVWMTSGANGGVNPTSSLLTMETGSAAESLGQSGSEFGILADMRWLGAFGSAAGVASAGYQAYQNPSFQTEGYLGFQTGLGVASFFLAPEVTIPIAVSDIAAQHFSYGGNTGWTAVANAYSDFATPQNLPPAQQIQVEAERAATIGAGL